MTPTVVWTEIPVRDISSAADFYAKVFGFKMDIDNSGPNPMAVFNGEMGGVGGHLYPGTPAQDGGNTVHLAVPDALEDAIKRCWDNGGRVQEQIVDIPFGRFAYAHDPDGNSIGLFEAKAA